MPLSHAVAWIGPLDVRVIQFDAAPSADQHVHYARRLGSQVRGQHEFFGEICEALAGIRTVLVVGHQEPQSAFRQYVSKHRPALALRIAAWKILDDPTEAEVSKLAREFFAGQREIAATSRLA
jgi:hypothetical protein